MGTNLSLERIKKILENCPLKEGAPGFNDIFRFFLVELLKIKTSNKKQIINSSLKVKKIQDSSKDSYLVNVDLWREPSNYYFYNLIRKKSYYRVDPSEAQDILENCIVKRYVSYKNIRNKLSRIKDDQHLIKKFSDDLKHETKNFFIEKKKNYTIGLEHMNAKGERKLLHNFKDESNNIDIKIDYPENDVSNFLEDMKIKNESIQRYVIWKYHKLSNINLLFKKALIGLPLNFNMQNIYITRYCFWNK